MNFSRTPLSALVVGLVACSVGIAGPSHGSSSPRVGCELSVQERANAMILRAYAHADQPGQGHYTLGMARHATGGSADIRQSGNFDLLRQGDTILTEIQLSDPKAPFTARLSVSLHGQTVTCTRAGL